MTHADPALAGRIPPGQTRTTKWPVLTYGRTPPFDPARWTFRCFGLVEREVVGGAPQAPARDAHLRCPLRHALVAARQPMGGRGGPRASRAGHDPARREVCDGPRRPRLHHEPRARGPRGRRRAPGAPTRR